MKLGAEPKKIAILSALVILGIYLLYTNVLSDSGRAPAARPAPVKSPAADLLAPVPAPPSAQGPVRRGGRVRTGEEFRPSLKHKPEDRPDPAKIDPTLRLDLLAKVQAAELEGGSRNLFQFSQPPAPPVPKDVPKVVPKTAAEIAKEKAEEKVKTAAKPAAPPINLKYFGFSTVKGEGRKKAFFLDGDEIYVASEGDVVKKRYRVVRIGVNSVVMEDTDSKSEQTLPLQEEAVG